MAVEMEAETSVAVPVTGIKPKKDKKEKRKLDGEGEIPSVVEESKEERRARKKAKKLVRRIHLITIYDRELIVLGSGVGRRGIYLSGDGGDQRGEES